MPRPTDINRHLGLSIGELSRRYRRARDAVRDDDLDWFEDYDEWYDDYWDPLCGRTDEDYLLFNVWEEALSAAVKRAKLGDLLPESLLPFAPPEPPRPSQPAEARPSFPPDELPDALYEHVQFVLSGTNRLPFVKSDRFLSALGRINGGLQGIEEAFAQFADRPGVIVMALLFAPFWVRPIASWAPPETRDREALIKSLVDHLFQVYPVPESLHRSWYGSGLPSLKWVLWLVLVGQGGSLFRAAPRFGWNISRRFTQHFVTAPGAVSAFEACMWAEIVRLGGSVVELERIRRNPGYVLDPSESVTGASRAYIEPGHENYPREPWRPEEQRREDLERSRSFWRQTVEWLIRHRDCLTDEMCVPILEWAMHRHTESLRLGQGDAFFWSGREPAIVHRAALEYRRTLETPHYNLSWNAHGFNWEVCEGDRVTWQICELTSWGELAEEGRAMHHCVASYAHRCALDQAAIFSLRYGGERRITVELAPHTRRIVQARGVCNGPAKAEEQVALSRWLLAIAADRGEEPKAG